MRRVIDVSEVLGEIETPDGLCDVCATATANYDEKAGKLIADLDAFLRTTDIRTSERKLSAEWLPKAQNLRESADFEEAAELARDIFHRWVHKVRESVPHLKTPQT